MKSTLLVFVVPLLVLGMLELFGRNDREVLVPSPQSVAEGFGRSLATKRYSQARTFLADSLEKSTSSEALRVYAEKLEQEIGPIDGVEGEEDEIHAETAEAVTKVRSRGKETSIRWKLVREKRLWKISELP